MKFAICNELFEGLTHRATFELVAKTGYAGIELAPFTLASHPRKFSSVQRRAMRQLAEDSGIEIVGLHWLLAKTEGLGLTSGDASVRQRTADYLVDLVDLCGDLGARVMVFGSPQQRNLSPGQDLDAGMELAAECLSRVVPALERTGVRLAMEPLGPEETNFLNTADQAQQLCERIGSENICLHLDVKAMSTEEAPISQIIRDFSGKFAHFHANDPNRKGPGMGDVDFVPIIRELIAGSYQGWVSVEVFDFEDGAQSIATRSINYLNKVSEQVSS